MLRQRESSSARISASSCPPLSAIQCHRALPASPSRAPLSPRRSCPQLPEGHKRHPNLDVPRPLRVPEHQSPRSRPSPRLPPRARLRPTRQRLRRRQKPVANYPRRRNRLRRQASPLHSRTRRASPSRPPIPHPAKQQSPQLPLSRQLCGSLRRFPPPRPRPSPGRRRRHIPSPPRSP